VAEMIMGNTICPLGDAAALPVVSFLSKFRADFEAQVKPRRVCAGAVVTEAEAEES
jgi:NADH-quinone oxidoreductase subunit F